MKRILLLSILIPNLAIGEIILSDTSIDESYSENVKVSGEFLVGIQTKANNTSKSLHVMFPENSTGELCIEITSIDGKYKANLKHSIIEPISNLNRIQFESKYQDILNNLKTNEVAIKASLRKSCDDNKVDKLLISSWANEINNELLLLIRSNARKDTVYIPNKKNSVIKAKCKKFRESNNISYDKFCLIKGIDINMLNSIEIVRRNLQPIESEKLIIN